MGFESGNISIHTENLLPIIKKWLYSDKDIFVRELVSNSNDAVSKLKRLASMGEAEVESDAEYYIKVVINKENKTIQVMDNGIGMTGEEVKKYINQIAFSGAQDFLEKYKDKADEGSQIIGHFGLGFYSAFMVSDRVQIDTLSYQKGSEAVRWTSSGGTEFEMSDSDRTGRGTTVTLYVSEDSVEFLDEFKVREVLLKYCSFLPFEIYLEDAAAAKDDKKEEKDGEPKPLNDTHPLWLKNPKDCTDDEYKEFYKNLFHDFNDPLFWIHLNMDYPFKLKGILYFPKLKHEFETNEGQIKLFYNQVFVADNIKEVIPEFLLLLKGVIDCPDLPLNVSRSFLQNDGYVSKISGHITRKVGDKLTALYENERDNYNKYWDDINPFVKYGCLREPKFYDRVKDIIIYKSTNGDYITLKEYLERNKDKHENKVFYVTDERQQAQYIKLFKEHEMEAIILPAMIDTHFIQFLETKESSVKFSRVDSDLSESLKDKDEKETPKDVQEALEKLFKEVIGDDKLKVQVEGLKAAGVSGMILLSEQSRRMQDMSRMFGGMDMGSMFPNELTLVLNSNNKLIQTLLKLKDREDRKEDVEMICMHTYDLALMSNKQLEPEAMTRFIDRSNKLLEKLAESED
jgi:molecular chaperone HtpG